MNIEIKVVLLFILFGMITFFVKAIEYNRPLYHALFGVPIGGAFGVLGVSIMTLVGVIKRFPRRK